VCQRLRQPVWPDAHDLAQFITCRVQHGCVRSLVEQGAYAVARRGSDAGADGLTGQWKVQRAVAIPAQVASPAGQTGSCLQRFPCTGGAAWAVRQGVPVRQDMVSWADGSQM
jgi:hypothetical protein